MNDELTTVTGDVFNSKSPIDITRGRKRKQADNLNIAIQEENSPALSAGNITIEKAIKFYEEQILSGQYDAAINSLYMQTALWLRELMSRKYKKTEDLNTEYVDNITNS